MIARAPTLSNRDMKRISSLFVVTLALAACKSHDKAPTADLAPSAKPNEAPAPAPEVAKPAAPAAVAAPAPAAPPTGTYQSFDKVHAKVLVPDGATAELEDLSDATGADYDITITYKSGQQLICHTAHKGDDTPEKYTTAKLVAADHDPDGWWQIVGGASAGGQSFDVDCYRVAAKLACGAAIVREKANDKHVTDAELDSEAHAIAATCKTVVPI